MITPVAFLVFNRPEHTSRVIEQIRSAQPKTLLVVADGPRPSRPDDERNCAAVRDVIESKLTWPCEVFRNYAATNMGCGPRVSSGLDWVFSQVERSIIVEDDCLPHETFFPFCEELLERYRDDERVTSISGCNLLLGKMRHRSSYFFSRIPSIWGWATWRRAWRHYDFRMALWPVANESQCLRSMLPEPRAYAFWRRLFEMTYAGRINTWDYQWTFASWINNGLTAVSASNLVKNIGIDEVGTHTTSDNPFAALRVTALDLPIVHPPFIVRDVEADDIIQNQIERSQAIMLRVRNRFKRLLRELGWTKA